MSRRSVVRAALLAAVLGGAALGWVLFYGRLNPAVIEAAISELGALAPLIFVGAFAAGTVVFAPGSLFGLAGGILFDALRYGALGLAALAIVAFVPRLIRRLRPQSEAFISLHDLKRSLGGVRRPLIVDVREPNEFDGPLGHIEGAIDIPLGQLPAVWDDLGDRAPPVVVVCRTDRRSAQAADILRARGVENVKVLRGGMEAWTKVGASPTAVTASP